MDNMNKEAIEKAGFKLDTAGKIRNAHGQPVKKEVAERVAAGRIIANFDMEAMKKARAAKFGAKGPTDLEGELRKISPDIELLKVGETAIIDIPTKAVDGKNPKRSFIMSVTAKLNHLTKAGGKWAGRNFDPLSDPGAPLLYVTRVADGEPKERKTGIRGKAAGLSIEEAMKKAAEHLGEGAEEEQD